MEEKGEMEVREGGEDLGLGFPFWVAAPRSFKSDDPFFAAGNMERELIAKQVALDLTEDERHQLQQMDDADTHTVFCPIVGCGARLNCLEDFEDHYHARHTASCSVCSRVYPTPRLLSIHVSEAHDSFFQAKVARGFPMYECLVEGCGAKLKSYKSRHQHLMGKHKFPSSFEFFKKSRPSKDHRRKNQRKHSGTRFKDSAMDVEDETRAFTELGWSRQNKQAGFEVEGRMDDLVSAVSKLSTSDSSPSHVSFGHRHARGFAFVPRSLRQDRRPDR